METNKITFDNVEIKYIKFGTGAKNLIVVPGISLLPVTNSGVFIEQAFKKFTSEYTIYLFDRNTYIKKGSTIHDFAEDLYKAIKLLNIEKADIYGTSQGGFMTMCLAINHPELVGKIVIASTCAKLPKSAEDIFNEWLKYVKEKDYSGLNKVFWDKLYTPEYINRYSKAFEHINDSATDEDYLRFIRQVEACFTHDIASEIKTIKCPMLLIGAENDPLFRKESFDLIVNNTGCENFMYKKYYHAVYDEAPDYLDHLYNFLIK